MHKHPSTCSALCTASSVTPSPTWYVFPLTRHYPGFIPILLPPQPYSDSMESHSRPLLLLLQVAMTEKLHLLLAELQHASQ